MCMPRVCTCMPTTTLLYLLRSEGGKCADCVIENSLPLLGVLDPRVCAPVWLEELYRCVACVYICVILSLLSLLQL